MKTTLLVLLLLASIGATAQTFTCDKLSARYRYSITKHIATDEHGLKHIDTIRVDLYDRQQQRLVQRIYPLTEASYLFLHCFDDCTTTRSYLTREKATAAVLDFDYGDLIVADFNFDGREDFAVKNDSGGSTGPYYKFYCSDESGVFTEDTYLSEEISYFPDILPTKKQLKVLRTVGCCTAIERIYQRKADAWQLISTREIK